MGRFFKATPTSFLDDAMYQHPTDLMQKALMTKEKSAQNRLALMKGVDDELEVNPHAKDRDNAIQIRDKIDQQKEDLIQDFYKNPDMDATRRSKLMNLQKEVKNQMSTGKIAQFNKNNKAIQARKKTLGEQYDKNPEKFRAFSSRQEVMDQVDYEYQGGIDKEGNLLEPTSFSLAESNDTMTDVQNALGKKTGKDFTGVSNIDGLKQKYSMEGFSNEEIENTMQSYVRSSDKIQNAIQQEYRVRNQSEDVSRQQVENEYYSRLLDTARQQFGAEMTKKVPINDKNNNGKNSQKSSLDLGNTAKGQETVNRINHHAEFAFEKLQENLTGNSKVDSMNMMSYMKESMMKDANKSQKGLKKNIENFIGEDFYSSNPKNKILTDDGSISEEALDYLNSNIAESGNAENVIDQFILRANTIKVKKARAQGLQGSEKAKYMESMMSQAYPLEKELETQNKKLEKTKKGSESRNKIERKIGELEEKIEKIKNPIESENITNYALNKALSGDQLKKLNSGDLDKSLSVKIPEVGKQSKIGEPGSNMTLGQLMEGMGDKFPDLFEESSTVYKDVEVIERTDQVTKFKYKDKDGEEKTVTRDNPSIIEKTDENSKTTITEAPEITMTERPSLLAKKVGGSNVVSMKVYIGDNETMDLLVDADTSGLILEGAKQQLQQVRDATSGFTQLSNTVSGNVVNNNGTINPQLRDITGTVNLGGGEQSVTVNDKGIMKLDGKSISERRNVENVLNALMKNIDTTFSPSVK